jgi:two-component system sensor histidine kinase YesM
MATLSRRFTAAFILIVAVPALLVSVALSRLYLSALYQTVARQAEATAGQVAQNIRVETDNVAVLLAALLQDGELRQSVELRDRSRDPRVRFQEARRIDAKLTSFFSYTKEVGVVVVRSKGGAAYTFSNYPNLRGLAGMDRGAYRGALEDPGTVYLFDTLEGLSTNIGEKNVISLAVCPAQRDDTDIQAILASFRVPLLDELGNRGGAPGDAAVVIFGRSGKPLLSGLPGASAPDLERLGRMAAAAGSGEPAPTVQELRAGGRTWLASFSHLGSTGWDLALLTDKGALTRRVTKYQWYLYPAVSLLLILFLAYAEVFFARIAGPVRALVGHMGRVGRGDYAVRADFHDVEELAELTRGFNRMVEEVDRLQGERERSEKERLAAELDALRYQINPHFVANTLNSIRLMASAVRADAIAGMTRDLMRVLADSYAGAGKLTELSREIENVRSYVEIMKVRFGELLTVAFELEPGTGDLLTLRMILQPIVENSILHGFKGAPEGGPGRPLRGSIQVSARLEPRELPPPSGLEHGTQYLPGLALVLEVHDDGNGMEPAAVRDLLERGPAPGGRNRIGLANVHRRIRLNFGEPYGLEVESVPGSHTRVRYVLPALARVEAQEAVHA